MTRLVYVTTSTTVGGAEKTLYTVATRVNRARFEVQDVISLKPKGHWAAELEKANIPVESLGVSACPGPAAITALGRRLAALKPDIVHAFLYQAMQACRLVKKLGLARFKLVSSPRVHYRSRSAATLLIDRLLKSADDLTVLESQSNRDFLRARLGYCEKGTEVIRNGIDASLWTPTEQGRRRVRAELGLGPEDLLIGAVGRLDRQKGHAYLIEAAAKLRPFFPVTLVLIGDGPLKPSLARLAAELRVDKHVRLIGERTDLADCYSALDVFALPSLWEGLPNALLEAMAAGLPCVATRVDGVPEIVDDGTTGILCEPGDSQALYAALNKPLADAGFRNRLGEAAKNAVRANFKFIDMMNGYEAAYDRVSRL